jgi:hypothetical protein
LGRRRWIKILGFIQLPPQPGRSAGTPWQKQA